MANPNPNSVRQKIINLPIGRTLVFPIDQRGSVRSQVAQIKIEFQRTFKTKSFTKVYKVTRIS